MRLLLLLLCLQPALLSAAPRVVTSVAPVFELTSAVMEGVGTPDRVIRGHASAHHFAFKPSHMKLLQDAELVIWVDRHFEAGFGRIDTILPKSIARLELLPALGGGDDGHFWYAPRQLQKAATLIADRLAELDPENRARYRDNAQRLSAAIETWRDGFAGHWRQSPLRLLTDHAWLGPFAKEFPQFDVRPVHDHHDDHGGLAEINRIETWLEAAPVACLLTLDAAPPALASSLADKYALRIVRIAVVDDALTGGGAIMQRLDNLRVSLERCA